MVLDIVIYIVMRTSSSSHSSSLSSERDDDDFDDDDGKEEEEEEDVRARDERGEIERLTPTVEGWTESVWEGVVFHHGDETEE